MTGTVFLDEMLLSQSAVANNQPSKHSRLLVREYPRLPALLVLDHYPAIVPSEYAKRADLKRLSHSSPQ